MPSITLTFQGSFCFLMLITIPQEMKLDRKGTLAKSIRRVDKSRVKHIRKGNSTSGFCCLLTSLEVLQCDVIVTLHQPDQIYNTPSPPGDISDSVCVSISRDI